MANPSDIMAGHAASLEALNQGQPTPVGPPGPDRGALRKIWDSIGDPRVQMWMLSAGNRLLNPERGESQFARFGNAIQQGYEGLGASMIMQRERERRTGLDERAQQADEARVGISQQQADTAGGHLGVAQRGVAVTEENVAARRQEFEETLAFNKTKAGGVREDKQTALRQSHEQFLSMKELQIKSAEASTASVEARRLATEISQEYARVRNELLFREIDVRLASTEEAARRFNVQLKVGAAEQAYKLATDMIAERWSTMGEDVDPEEVSALARTIVDQVTESMKPPAGGKGKETPPGDSTALPSVHTYGRPKSSDPTVKQFLEGWYEVTPQGWRPTEEPANPITKREPLLPAGPVTPRTGPQEEGKSGWSRFGSSAR